MSRHVLGAAVGCLPRHAFDAETDLVEVFPSGQTNVDEEADLDHGHTRDEPP